MAKAILTERETRKNVLELARFYRCEPEIRQLFFKYDTMLKNCTNPRERDAIALAANQELHFFMDSKPGFLQVFLQGGSQIIGK